jgi:hypothetical protein
MAVSKHASSCDFMSNIRKEMDSLGKINVAADMLCGAQTQRSLEHFSIGKDLIPRGDVSQDISGLLRSWRPTIDLRPSGR